MPKSQIDSITLVLAAALAALGLTHLFGEFAWMGSIVALIALLILFSFDREGYRTAFQSFVFSAVCGFCAAVASGIIYRQMATQGEVHLANSRWATEYLPLTCAFATAIFWAIDLMRMNARKVAPIQVPRALGETSILPMQAQPITPAQAPPVIFGPPRPTAPPVQTPPVVFTPPPAAPMPAPLPVERMPEPVAPPPPLAPAPAPESPTATRIFVSTPPEPQAPPPLSAGPAPIIPRTGKETMIYVSLLGEGLNVLRSVRAEALGRDYYRIVDEMPEGETWQFQPGQVVRCKKQKLSTGKAMVAFEEAPRATA